MSFQLHPIAFGVMLVVAVGTLAYNYWNSRQHNNYGYERPNRHETPYSDFDFDEPSSPKSSPEIVECPPRKKRNADRCAICLGSLKSSLKPLKCSHIFHEHCITAWLLENNTCPICRKVTP
ncbi:hypothetical protein NQ318_002731 [Aromia moschata]|uniref:RING-type domain-containing protein n=1 Tax=Aromia moschata TaxID=1265417 RepID=A0AAV8Y454_9CUCU|nr:hypothetical protein NQ318_002731 [Aromia moschata]